MMTDSLILEKIQTAFPQFKLAGSYSGILYNVSIYTEKEWYQFDIVENEVGLIYREPDHALDFAGSDVAFETLEEAIIFLTNYRVSMGEGFTNR